MQLLAGSSGTELDAGKAAQTTGRTKIAQPVASTFQKRVGVCCNPTSGVTQGLRLNQFKGFVALDTHTQLPFLHLQLILLGSFAPLCIPSYNFYHLLLFEHGVARKTSLI